VSRTTPALRATLAAVVGLGAAAALTGCFGPAPQPSATPKPTTTGFASIGDDTPEPIDTGVPVDPTEPPTDGYTALTDDYNVLSIQVPAAWTDVDTAPFTDDGGQEWASIVASPDIATYYQSYNASGMEFAGAPVNPEVTDDDIKGFLDTVTNYFLSDCDVLAQGQAYNDGFYVGFQSAFENCGGVDTEGFGIVALDNSRTQVVYLRAQVAGADDPETVYNQLAASFQSSIGRAAKQ
jgi:hypothetical protein